jgi:hypothetical protein
MNTRITDEAGSVAADVSQQSLNLVNEMTRWITGNLGNILVAAAIGTTIALLLRNTVRAAKLSLEDATSGAKA